MRIPGHLNYGGTVADSSVTPRASLCDSREGCGRLDSRSDDTDCLFVLSSNHKLVS